MEKKYKFGFLSHDWREQMDISEINHILREINEPAQITEMPTHSDEYGYIVHSKEIDIKSELTYEEFDNLWCNSNDVRFGDIDEMDDEFAISYHNGILHVTLDTFRKLAK